MTKTLLYFCASEKP